MNRRFDILRMPLLVCGLLGTGTFSQEPTQELDLEQTQTEYTSRVQKIRDSDLKQKQSLKVKYLGALLKEEAMARREQNLDLVLLLRAEIELVEEQEVPEPFNQEAEEPIRSLRKIYHGQLNALDSKLQQELRVLGEQVLHYGKRRQGANVQSGNVEKAVAWRDWLIEVEASLPQTDLKQERDDDSDPPLQGIPHILTVWNCHHAGLGVRGSKTADLEVFYKGRKVFRKKGIQLNWKKDGDPPTDISFQVPAFDEILLTIPEWYERGVGLSEVEVKRGGRTKMDIVEISVSGKTKAENGGEKLIDGIKTSEKFMEGYWLPPPEKASWIRVKVQ